MTTIGVAGLWHLGVVYASAFAELGNDVIAFDPATNVIEDLISVKLPVFEPGLEDLILKHIKSGRLKFTSEVGEMSKADLLIITFDTPVNDYDEADVEFVFDQFKKIAPHVQKDAQVLIASQLPVGSGDKISEILSEFGGLDRVSIQPENLRLGKALDTFFRPDRIIVGTSDGKQNSLLQETLGSLEVPIIWMHRRSAEMTKHALNAFLATSITFMGEISELCERFDADASEVEVGLKSEKRIGSYAYLSPGLGFAGGTLARDVKYLMEMQRSVPRPSSVLKSLLESNHHNNNWIARTINQIHPVKNGLNVCFWGVSYVENTNTLRRSEIYSLMEDLISNGANISFVENFVLSEEINPMMREFRDLESSLEGIDVLVVSKKLENLFAESPHISIANRNNLKILDPARILLRWEPMLIENSSYFTVGKGI